MTALPSQRHLFDIPEEVAYLNCAYMSPLMNAVRDAGFTAVRKKTTPWLTTPADFFTGSESTRALFATLIGAGADDIAIVPSVSYGLAVAARNIPVRANQEIIVLEDQFPSNVYIWRKIATDNGARIRTIMREEAGSKGNQGCNWSDAIIAAIGDQTAVVALPHCHWTDGTLVDPEAVGKAARHAGAALVLDITQSGGAMPFDVAAIQPDFVICACYKWLLGPYSLGFVYAAPKHHNGEPLEQGWIVRTGSEDFARLVDYQDEMVRGARRFDMGERSNFQLMPMAQIALRQILDWGVENIAETLAAVTSRIAERGQALGLEAAAPGERASHFLGLRFASGVPANLIEHLKERNVYVSVRGDSVRITPHLFNDEGDIDRLFAALRATM